MGLQLADTDERRAFGQAIAVLCADHFGEAGEDQTRPFDRVLWRALGRLGTWSVASTGGGDVTDAAVVAEALGSQAICGPVVQTFLVATAAVDDPSAPEVEAGTVIVAVVEDETLTPWAPVADAFYRLEHAAIALAPMEARLCGETSQTLAGEPWGDVESVATAAGVPAERAVATANVVAAAFAIGAGGRSIEETVSYTSVRRQFDRPLLSFQSVEHRLAQVTAELGVAAELVASAANDVSTWEGTDLAAVRAQAAAGRLYATDVALRACLLAHQLAGGMGFVAGSLLASLSTRVQQLVHQPPQLALVEATVAAFATEHR